MDDNSIQTKLRRIADEIKTSWYRDCDRTQYMIELTDMLKGMITKESLEDYFSEEEKTLQYFMGEFMDEVIGNILIQPKIYGDNGDEIGLNLLFNIFNLFIKFHKNSNYSTLFEKIRNIFHNKQGSTSFFTSHKYGDNNFEEKNFDSFHFNSKYCPEFEKKGQQKRYNIGDEVDFFIDNNYSRSMIDKKSWVRGRVKDIVNDEYIIEYCDNNEARFPINDYNLYPVNTKTTDWDWRLSLKKDDVIDCFDRNKWYPATVLGIEDEQDNNGFKKVTYKIGFRLYPKTFKNPEDGSDTYDKHIDFWKNSSTNFELRMDDNNEEYAGDLPNFDEGIIFYSKRIQKFNTYSAIQQKYLKDDHGYNGGYTNYNNNDEKTEIKLMNEKLTNDTDVEIDNYYYYEVNGKKNYILAKNKNCYYYFVRFLKMIEIEKGFDKFIEILKNEPNTEEIYNIFYMLTYSFPYLHKEFFRENSEIIKTSLINYINGLKEKEMINLPKDLINIVSDLLYKINEDSEDKEKDESEKNKMSLYDEITLTLSIKTIKTNIFDRRLQGIKALNEYIEKNEKNKEMLKKIIELIKTNNIISEIFGTKYHSQIIIKSKEIIKLLLLENELSEDDIKLIWDCTKKGDLEAKLTILKLLSDLAPYLKENYIEMLLDNIRTNVDKKNNEQEIELVYKLSIQGKDNEKKNRILLRLSLPMFINVQ